jgi:tetratricopeptide (TPR) repeat protein
MAYSTLGKLAEAEADFTRAVSLDPSYARAYLGRAMVKLRLRRFDDANADFDAVLRLHKDDQEALLGRKMAQARTAPDDLEATGSVTPLAEAAPAAAPAPVPATIAHAKPHHKPKPVAAASESYPDDSIALRLVTTR